MEEPTQKQAEVYRLIIDHVELFGFQPSYAELARVLGVSKKAVVDRMKQLEAKGLVSLPGGRKERATTFHYVRFDARSVGKKSPDLKKSVWRKLVD